jgi:membrane-associated phospholipid phosphatase
MVVATMLAETILLNDGPARLPSMTSTIRGLNRSTTRLSFVSGHTANTGAPSFFAATVLHDLNPDSPSRPYFWAGAAVVPQATAYARYRAGKHFLTNIAAGYALGAAPGILIP